MNAKLSIPRLLGRLGAVRLVAIGLATSLVIAACSDGDTGPQGPPGEDGGKQTGTDLEQGDDLPGINVMVTSLSGGTGPGGRFLPGDTISVNFTIQKNDGSDWDLAEISPGRALVSGPTFNYQRVIAQVSNVSTAAVQQADGSYRYTFATPIPATYLAPLNDSSQFDDTDGELTGQALLEGTYTLGMYFRWDYMLDGETRRDSGDVVHDFVIGTTGAVDSRQVVSQDNCNRCHSDLQAHGGSRHTVTLCLLCHTTGSEDTTEPTGVSVDFKVMIHKIHSGKHLPSVLGVATNPDGSRNYAATPMAYLVGGHDYSGVAFPAWPHGLVATPRDEGYTALSAQNRAKENTIRTGPSNCIVCHGDPDGDSGPLTAPAQGDLAFAQPSRAACGSCHDDVHWDQNYTANGLTMLSSVTVDDTLCLTCHVATGPYTPGVDLPPNDAAHLHPLLDPTFDPGTVIEVTSLVEDGANDGDGTIDPGEKIDITFTLQNDAGADVLPADVANPSVVIAGPTGNYNLLLSSAIPVAALTGPQPFTVNVPMAVLLERVGVATAAPGETFTSAFTPHWNVTGALTSVRVRTAATTTTTLAEATAAPQNYIDVADATGFARNDYIAVDDGRPGEEYVQIQNVIGNRLWFSALGSTSYKPGLDLPHAVGATVREVTLVTLTVTADYTVDAGTGTITEVTEFGDGNVVLVSYTTDFVMPSVYPLTLNDTPTLDETSGKWVGKSVVDGTYSLSVWTTQTLTLNLHGETNSYRTASDADLFDFLVGDAADVEPYDLISSGSNCYNCHQDVGFHGFGRRSYDSCVVCHGAAGTEDRTQYVAGNAPATDGVTITFRTMLHKIHMGRDLANASSYTVVGFGSGAFPNNFTAHTYGEVAFPAMPGGTNNCTKCHGSANESWLEPSVRNHPTDQGSPVLRWAAVCGSCHDSDDALAHIAVQTTGAGAESCGVCHGPGKDWSVERVHKTY